MHIVLHTRPVNFPHAKVEPDTSPSSHFRNICYANLALFTLKDSANFSKRWMRETQIQNLFTSQRQIKRRRIKPQYTGTNWDEPFAAYAQSA